MRSSKRLNSTQPMAGESAPAFPVLLNETGEAGLQGQSALLTVNSSGCITACNPQARALLGWTADSPGPEGERVTNVLPELPFSPATPGYNLAYAVFHAANGLWTRRLVLLADGRKIFVDIALSSVVVKFRRFITLSLRVPDTGHSAPVVG